MLPKYGLFDFFESHSIDVTKYPLLNRKLQFQLPTDLAAIIEHEMVIGVKRLQGRKSGARAPGKKTQKSVTSVYYVVIFALDGLDGYEEGKAVPSTRLLANHKHHQWPPFHSQESICCTYCMCTVQSQVSVLVESASLQA